MLGKVQRKWFIVVSLVTIMVFFFSAVVFVDKYKLEMKDYEEARQENLLGLKQRAKNLSFIPYYIQTFQIEPSVNRLLCEGFEKSLPNTFRMDVFSLQIPESQRHDNYLISRFLDLDWTFIIHFILSFVALLITYNSFSAEREQGTLSLMLANPVPRSLVILGKYASTMLILLALLSSGTIISVTTVRVLGIPYKRIPDVKHVVLFLLLSMVFLSVFALIGMLFSCLASDSSYSMVILIFIWIIFCIIIPSFGRVVAEKTVNVLTRTELEREVLDSRAEIMSKADSFGPEAGNYSDGPANPQARTRMFNTITEAKNQIIDDYIKSSLLQIQEGRKFTQIFPTSLFQYSAEAINKTGMKRFENIFVQLKKYQKTLRNFIVTNDREDPESMHLLAEWEGHYMMLSQKPVSFDSIPKFEESDTESCAKDVIYDFSLLILWNIVLGFTLFFSFRKADVREM